MPEITLKNLSGSEKELEVEFSKEEFNSFFDSALFSLGKDLEIKGFRKGTAPKEILEERLNPQMVLNKAAELAIEKTLYSAIAKENLELILPPQIEVLKLAKNNPFLYRARLTVLPEIKLPDYKEIASNIKKEEVSVSEKEIDNTLFEIQKSRAKITPLNQKAEKGNFIEIEYQYQIEKGILSQKIKDSFILGKGGFLEGFEENLEEMLEGEEKEFSLKAPDDYFFEDFRGKEINFKVKLIKVNRIELPEISDEFAKSLGSFNGIEDLRNSIREGILMEKEIEEREKRKFKILEAILKETNLESPEILINFEKENLYRDLKKSVDQILKISWEDYLKRIKKTEEEIDSELKEMAKKRIKSFLVLKEIGKKEGITVSEDEVEMRINKELKNITPEMAKDLDLDEKRGYYRNIIYNEKVFNRLLSYSEG
jgi:trigger factor